MQLESSAAGASVFRSTNSVNLIKNFTPTEESNACKSFQPEIVKASTTPPPSFRSDHMLEMLETTTEGH